jgi:hypothetical protein
MDQIVPIDFQSNPPIGEAKLSFCLESTCPVSAAFIRFKQTKR